MFYKILTFTFFLTFFIACRTTGETVVNGQVKVETNSNSSSIVNEQNLPVSDKVFAKAFITKSSFDDLKGTVTYKSYPVQFTDDDLKGISVYIDGSKKDSLLFEIANPKVKADFLDRFNRYFVMVIGAPGAGVCGDAIFAIVRIDENLKVKISKPNAPNCQGEIYSVKIENKFKEKDLSQQITIGELKFDLESFSWIANKYNHLRCKSK